MPTIDRLPAQRQRPAYYDLCLAFVQPPINSNSNWLPAKSTPIVPVLFWLAWLGLWRHWRGGNWLLQFPGPSVVELYGGRGAICLQASQNGAYGWH